MADRCRECGVAITVKPAKDEACERRHQRIVEILNRDPESFYSQYVGTESPEFKALDALWTFNTRCALREQRRKRRGVSDHIRGPLHLMKGALKASKRCAKSRSAPRNDDRHRGWACPAG